MTSNSDENEKFTLANAWRRLVQTFWIAIFAVPLWVIGKGDEFSWNQVGFVALAAAIIWVLLFVSDLIIDAFKSFGHKDVH
jgi:hypothetical protein